MESQDISENRLSKSETILSKSHFAGNFSETDGSKDKEKDIYMIKLDSIKDYIQYLPYLPQGFGFSGGVARNALLFLLGESPPKYRDIDVEGIGELIKNKEDVALIQNEHGGPNHHIDVNKSLITYFSTRDFTLNEVFLYGNHLYYSRRALEDTSNKVIRPTEYEKGDDDEIKPKLLIKALLLQIEFIKQYGHGEIKDIEDWQWQFGNIPAFNLALGLDKASQKDIHMEFLKKLFDLGAVTEEDLPQGLTLESIRRLAGLTKHWMIERDHDRRDFVFSDEYFAQAYKDEWKMQDDTEFDRKYREAITRAIKIGKGISGEDLELD